MVNKKKLIIDTAANLIAREGVRLASIEKLSAGCNISKKTFYQHFANKEALIMELIRKILRNAEQFLRVNLQLSPNALAELLDYFNYTKNNFTLLSQNILDELVRTYPDAINLISYYRENILGPFIVANLERGLTEGLYKKDVNSKLTADLYCYIQEKLLNDPMITEPCRWSIFDHINKMFVNSIVTDKGERYLLFKQQE